MAGEIFISYRRADEAWARLLYNQLKAEGVEAWYDAHVGAGQDWRAATAAALSKARIFVLLFSKAASESDDIVKELAAATFSKKLVVPVRIENLQPEGAFLYELASRNWVNAFENKEAKFAELAQSLAKLVKASIADESVIPFDRNAGAKVLSRKGKQKPVVMAIAAIAVIATLGALLWVTQRPATPVADVRRSSGPAGVSIAVLPLLNLSSDKDQEYFSDGMTEEITSALAKVPGLTVIGRTSAFQFKGANKDMRAIGAALGAKNLIEGSVRKAGNQVRITIQLIKTSDGTHLWTESYDRKLTDIFAVQEDIATAIASALQVPLGLSQRQNLVSSRTDDLDAYQQYLHGRALFRARHSEEAIATLKGVVAQDPNYAPAWALLSVALMLPSQFNDLLNEARAGDVDKARVLANAIVDQAEKAARQAIRLDPQLAMGYLGLADVEFSRGNAVTAVDDSRKALALDPNDPDILYNYASFLADFGRLQDSRRVQLQILAQEPFIPNYNRQAADVLWAMGQNDAALKLLEAIKPDQGRNIGLARVYAAEKRYALAADTLETATDGPISRQTLQDAARLLRSAPGHGRGTLPAFPQLLNWVYLFVGAQDRYLDEGELRLQVGLRAGLFRDPWAPAGASLRKMERFKSLMRHNGYVAYWRARGWPDLCHPVGADDFACN